MRGRDSRSSLDKMEDDLFHLALAERKLQDSISEINKIWLNGVRLKQT